MVIGSPGLWRDCIRSKRSSMGASTAIRWKLPRDFRYFISPVWRKPVTTTLSVLAFFSITWRDRYSGPCSSRNLLANSLKLSRVGSMPRSLAISTATAPVEKCSKPSLCSKYSATVSLPAANVPVSPIINLYLLFFYIGIIFFRQIRQDEVCTTIIFPVDHDSSCHPQAKACTTVFQPFACDIRVRDTCMPKLIFLNLLSLAESLHSSSD